MRRFGFLFSGVVLLALGLLSGCAANTKVMRAQTEVRFAASLVVNRRGHTATRLANGTVFIAGGESYVAELERFIPVVQSELFEPGREIFVRNATLEAARTEHTATLLADGRVLLVGGRKEAKVLYETEIYLPAQNLSFPGPLLETPRYAHTATLLKSGSVLIANGQSQEKPLSTVEIFLPATNNFKIVGHTIYLGANRTATALGNDLILFTGGVYQENGLTYYNKGAELYDAVRNVSRQLPDLKYARAFHTATLLPNGKVLLTGGKNNTGELKTAEIFDPLTNNFYLTGMMQEARTAHTATALDEKRVLLTGGVTGEKVLASTEIYELTTGRFTPSVPLHSPRQAHTATLLTNGAVLLAGGGFGENTERLNITPLSLAGELFYFKESK